MEWNPKNGPENPDIDHFIIFKKLIAVFFLTFTTFHAFIPMFCWADMY